MPPQILKSFFIGLKMKHHCYESHSNANNSNHLLKYYYVSGTVISTLHTSSHVIFTKPNKVTYDVHHADGKTDAQ